MSWFRSAMLVWLIVPFAAQAQVCTFGDANGDTDVDFADFGSFQLCHGDAAGEGCAAFDFDGDLDIDQFDLDAFQGALTLPLALFDYGASPRANLEAELLALENGLSLLATDVMYERILRDLAAIRVLEPAVVNVIHDMAWGPTQLIVKLNTGADRCAFDEMNAFYKTTDVQFLFDFGSGPFYLVHYPGRMRMPLLGTLYAVLDEVEFAEPDGLIGTDDRITIQTASPTWTYTIDDGFLDCFDGCDCHVVRTFEVDANGVAAESDLNCFGQSWCVLPDVCLGK